jgi:hypothetical protein
MPSRRMRKTKLFLDRIAAFPTERAQVTQPQSSASLLRLQCTSIKTYIHLLRQVNPRPAERDALRGYDEIPGLLTQILVRLDVTQSQHHGTQIIPTFAYFTEPQDLFNISSPSSKPNGHGCRLLILFFLLVAGEGLAVTR